ncbi:TKL protein kinase [Saprolegnia parasitica CBS 223.65]|uniref:TKL protein kinase n=1 Tax=Saprolegnia parasitica (strain CBS 223.65) TaxID=695850 RepID=A0A067C8G0_SAPPC|nr:TKL protein kinase [Saprolegnia parasitica CBS 223.65]KDO22821.1 TKL protein kinase [Saprolegnia parasitica CBS 223.65]|eukprot:XP_012206492.1 TKL protein kinase [Saprolegnia parasitica CBS 223.65]
MQSPGSRDVYQIYHSNIHSCAFADNVCNAYDNGVYIRDHTSNTLANFSANYSATYATTELSFPRSGSFIIFAHIALPGSTTSERFDFAVYRTITVGDAQVPTPVGLIVGVAVGGVVLLLGITFFVYRCRRNHSSKTTTTNTNYRTQTSGPDETQTWARDSATETALAQWRLNEDDVERLQILSKGAYGEVWLGTYRGTPVAIKKLLPGRSSPSDVQDFAKEILLMTTFSSPYIVACIGVSWYRRTELMLLVEFMDSGDLRTKLDETTPASFSIADKLLMASQIAEALVYLHSLETPVIHRDMKSRNVLLDSTKGTKLTDFGVSRAATSETMTIGIGTYRWMAPEILTENHYSEAADIYSFGVILSELDTHLLPYSDQTNQKGNPITDTSILGLVMHGQIQPTLRGVLPEWTLQLAKQCLSYHPEDRPTAFGVAYALRQRENASI